MKITIPKPCHENWDAMTKEEKGRFCSVCSKTVRDFTVATDDEIINAFANPSEKNICGYFDESQLDRDLQYSHINSLFIKFAVGFMLTAGGFVSVNAQENKINDTLQAEKLEEVVIAGFKKTTHSMVTGKPYIISDSSLVKSQQVQSGKKGKVISSQLKNSIETQKIRIGGASSSLKEDQKPIVVLDGKMISLEEFRKIDTQSIETLTVLKDKKAKVLYGEDGKNGVILVTTKKK
ncbi:hypothetical protein VUJ46_06085 [Chryseobacterium sp. MYb264]|uniref:hypothetical protein n=1 Tax=Chryseobacterium sp. MYb264 TaxID=2745153 RepID=UPI002E0ED20E|nr:hypothetical protein VUJ46_06085 [Chryseobacterium sp. MYb264]